MREKLQVVRDRLKRPLTMSEKILFSHLREPAEQELDPGNAFLNLQVDRVIMQDATAQMAVLQFMQSGRHTVAVPTSIHCDHLIRAYEGALGDTRRAVDENKEVYAFLKNAASKFGMGFWGPGSGIIHQVVLENYAVPGGLMIGSDSHTPNMGGLGMLAIGVGGADAVDGMAGLPWELLQPKLVGVKLTGEMNGWTSAKDIILWVAGQLTVKGGTNRVVEYFGPGVRSISATGRATITNMGAEIGATSSIFPYDERSKVYMRATERGALVDLADQNLDLFNSDPEVEANPEKYYDVLLELNLSELEPYVVGPFTPDLARPVSQLRADVEKNGYPAKISASMVGSCTNSSYEDITRAAAVARQALDAGAKTDIPLMITPGSQQVLRTVQRDGLVDQLQGIGAKVMANACGPCIGQWKRDDIQKGESNTIVNSYNRNFPGRNDDNPNTYSFVTSPEVTVAFALAGTIACNPLKDPITTADGKTFTLQPPPRAPEVPAEGFVLDRSGYVAPAADPSAIDLRVPMGSERLQILEPFSPMVEPELSGMPVLFKTKGKTTTDHISPAGAWLRYRGHLDKISDNMLLGATNGWTGERGKTVDVFSGQSGTPAEVARHYKAEHKRWVIVGDENYGEGSSREHAAMSPRWLGCAAVIARSFARIHKSNLKKQGILPLVFQNPADYDKIRQGDKVTLEYIQELDPVRSINMLVCHEDGTHEVVTLRHDLTMEHLAWFHAGSALSLLRKQFGGGAEGNNGGMSEASDASMPSPHESHGANKGSGAA